MWAAASTAGNRVGIYLGTASGLRFHTSYATAASPRDLVVRDLRLVENVGAEFVEQVEEVHL